MQKNGLLSLRGGGSGGVGGGRWTKKNSHAFGERGQVGGHVGEAPSGAVDGGADARTRRRAAGGGSGGGCDGRPQNQQQQRRTHSTQLTSHHQQLDSTRNSQRLKSKIRTSGDARLPTTPTTTGFFPEHQHWLVFPPNQPQNPTNSIKNQLNCEFWPQKVRLPVWNAAGTGKWREKEPVYRFRW